MKDSLNKDRKVNSKCAEITLFIIEPYWYLLFVVEESRRENLPNDMELAPPVSSLSVSLEGSVRSSFEDLSDLTRAEGHK